MTENEKRLVDLIQNITRDGMWFNIKVDPKSNIIYMAEEYSLEVVSLEELILKLEKMHT